MAVTKIHAIKSTLSKAIAYIENPRKTDGQIYVSGYNTEPQTASLDFEMTATMARKSRRSVGKRKGNLAYHLRQSFSPDDDLTPEQAHELGRKLASEYTEGRYEFVVATHLDKDQLHNHIIINAVSFYDYKKLRTVPYRTARQVRGISDRLCAEAELSVLEEPRQIGQRYSDYIKKHKTIPARTQVRRRLNFVLARATDYDQFKAMALALGVTVSDKGKHIAYRYAGAGKAVRGNKLADTDKYLPDGIKEQLEINAANQDKLRSAIRATAATATSMAELLDKLNQQGIRTRVDKRTGSITYIMPDADESRVPEDVLGPGMSRTAIADAINGNASALVDTPPVIDDLLALYQSKQRGNANTPATLVTVTQRQILQASRDGLLLAVKDRNGNDARLMLDADHVEGKPDGTVQIALGSAYEYDIVYSSGQHGAVRGSDLIRHIELANGVSPTWVNLASDQIKSMSLKGVTITLPESGIDRVFIPAEYVRYDKAAGTCHVAIYDNWDYSIVPVTDETGKTERRNIKGALLADTVNAYQAPQQGDSLRHRIAYVERKATLANVRHLAATLNTMSRGNMHTAADFAPALKRIQKEMQSIAARISETKQKNKQYAIAARCLTTCQAYKATWQKYLSTPGPMKALYKSRHKSEIEVYSLAVEQLERMDVRPDVEPAKVQQLIQDRERQIELDTKRFDELKKEEADLLNQQRTVQELQSKKERNVTYGDFRL